MGKFYAGKHCVYLDQFAVSNLVDQEDWSDLLALLKKGINEQKIIVPYSFEHLVESSKMTFEKAKVVDNLLFSLSNGITLKNISQIIPLLLISAIRNRPVNAKTYTFTATETVFSNPVNFNELRNRKTIFDQMSQEGTSQNNKIREITREGKRLESSQHPAIFKTLQLQASDDLRKRLIKFHRYGFYDKTPVKYSMTSIPYWADFVMDTLIHEYLLTKDEAKRCESLILKNGLKTTVPPVHVRSTLEAMLAIKQQKETANDHFDILRMSLAITFADIVITDKSKVFDIKNSNLHNDYNTNVYSGSKTDLTEFKSKIQSIVL